jgi:glycosyltransferase involved in cell wall biosynthesis
MTPLRIGFATTDWAMNPIEPDPSGLPQFGGAGHYRIGLPSRALAAAGHHVVVGTLLGAGVERRDGIPTGDRILGVRTWDEQLHWDLDIIVIQREMAGPAAADIRSARQAGQVVINDVDDWFFGLDPSNRAFVSVHPRYSPGFNIVHYRAALAESTMLTASTEYLAGRLRQMFPNVPVVVLRNMIDLDAGWRMKAITPYPPTIGWAGAIPWRSGDLEAMRGILGQFLTRHDLRFHHSGHMGFREQNTGVPLPTFAEAAGLPGRYEGEGNDRRFVPDGIVTHSGMVAVTNIPRLYDPFDVGIVPLADKPFNEAKSTIKGMEYAAAGIPFVAAATSEYRRAAAEGLGVVARRPRDWFRQLERLLDPDERRGDRERNYAAVEKMSVTARWREWEDLYQSFG